MLHSIPLGILSFSSGGYQVDNSAVFNDDDTDFLTTTPSSAGNTKTWTVAFWWKVGKITTGSVKDTLFAARSSNPYLFLQTSDGSPFGRLFFGQFNGSSYDFELYTDMALRDPHAWYHIVIAVDTTQAIDNNRVKIYVNGSQVTFGTSNYPSQNLETYWNTTYAQNIGHDFGSRPMDGYLAEWVNVDGSQLSSTNFGETDDNGVWRPIEIDTSNFLNYSTTDETTGASAAASGGGSPGAAIDNDTSTQWSEGSAATSAGATWTVTFGSAKHIRKITQVVASGNNVATGQKLQYHNGSTFVDVGAFTMVANSTKQTFYFGESAASTQWRLISTTAVGNPYSWALNEVEMFEASNGIGTNGFYLPFTASDYLGADYSSDYATTNTSAHFDGSNDYLTRGSNLTGLSDGTQATFSAWFRKTSGDSANRNFFTDSGGHVNFKLQSDNKIRFHLHNSSAAELVDMQSTNAIIADGLWHHVMFSANTSSNTSHLYVDGVDVKDLQNSQTGTIDYTSRGNFSVGGTTSGGNKWFGDLGEVYFTNEFVDLSQASNRLKFLTSDAKPANLGSDGSTPTGTQAILYLANAFGTFQNNLGSGGNFTENGELTVGAGIRSTNANDLSSTTPSIGDHTPTKTTDSPTTNAATFSSLITRHQTSFNGVASDWTFTNGNRTLTHTSGSSGDIMAAASQLLQPGQKYHFEAVTESMHSSAYARFALALVPQSMWETDASPLTGTNDQFTISLIKSGGTGSNTAAFDNGSLTAPTNKPTTNSRLTFEVDMSTIGSTTVRYYFNGSLDTTYSSLAFADEPYYVVSFTGTETDRNGVFNFNFGSSAFTDTPTSGHTGLTAKDAFAGSAPTIVDGSAQMQITTYEGGASGTTREVIQSTRVQANLETGNNETNNGDMSGAVAGIRFVCTRTGQCPSIHIRTSSTGMSGVTCQVKQDGGTGQSPSGSVLTNGEKTGVSFSGQGYAIFDFPNGGPELTAGTIYWFLIPSDTGTWGIARDNDNSEGGPGGRISSSDGTFNTGSFGHKIFQVLNKQFKPDLVWLKARTQGRHNHLIDAVRGSGKTLQSNQNNTEGSNAPVSDFNSNGFDVVNNSDWDYNDSGTKEVAWQWLAGNSTASNSNGSITSTVSVNQTAGFSIVSYQGHSSSTVSTVGHGLSGAPSLVICKNRDVADGWAVGHLAAGFTQEFSLSSSVNGGANTAIWNNTAPSPTVFTVGTSHRTNGPSENIIAYCFQEISGFSKFGSFSSGSSGDPFVHCGFTPALIFLKRTSSNDSWYVHDTARDPNNPAFRYLQWNDTAVEASNSSVFIDIISNGFVCDLGSIVTSSDDMIFGAWASNPFAGSTPATAR
tara:strand:- start:104 stop:4132 length:4029 start_codon:yes stop_codon:yes gene_type:complete